jgi:hypothetical protein
MRVGNRRLTPSKLAGFDGLSEHFTLDRESAEKFTSGLEGFVLGAIENAQGQARDDAVLLGAEGAVGPLDRVASYGQQAADAPRLWGPLIDPDGSTDTWPDAARTAEGLADHDVG